MTEPYYDEPTRDLFREILQESIQEYRDAKALDAVVLEDLPPEAEEPPQESAQETTQGPVQADPEPVPQDPPVPPETPPEKPVRIPSPRPPAEPLAEPVDGPTAEPPDPWRILHRSMYVLSMHRGRPHARTAAFQRRWLEQAVHAIYHILADLPEDPPEEGAP